MTALARATLEFAKRLTWYAEHGVNIYQFLGEQHVDDAQPRLQPRPHRVGSTPKAGRPRKARVASSAGSGGFGKITKRQLAKLP